MKTAASVRILLGCAVGIGLTAAEALADPFGPTPQQLLESIVITEAAGEPFDCQVGVAEVLRNRRWNPEGFIGIQRKDLDHFLKSQPAWVHHQAQEALEAARNGSNLTRQATHFENVEDFGLPRWARSMNRTVKLGRLTFFRSRKIT